MIRPDRPPARPPLETASGGRLSIARSLAMLQPPRGYRALAWLGLVANVLAIPLVVAVILGLPTWRTVHIAVGSAAVLPTAAVGILASVALLKWRAWGQILAIVGLSMSLAVSMPYGIVRLAMLSEGRLLTAVLCSLVWTALIAALVFWCRPCIRRYLV
ncbi:Hepatitis C virus core protein [Cyanobium sp. ATX 6A2]|uniref:Hepatitis C virus core protein n=1 Tax=Cyanobium sp. ATX 6A2 TaxID=2823700 RepID=UPI0020CEB9B1|nr:Hepatitis C virus core protein [Cyanobium sp. ATX 6A2]